MIYKYIVVIGLQAAVYMRSDKFGSQLSWKSKTWSFTFLHVYVSWTERDKILISQLSPPKFKYFTDQNVPKGGGPPWKRILIFFKYENEYHKQGSKSRWKKWGLVSFFPF